MFWVKFEAVFREKSSHCRELTLLNDRFAVYLSEITRKHYFAWRFPMENDKLNFLHREAHTALYNVFHFRREKIFCFKNCNWCASSIISGIPILLYFGLHYINFVTRVFSDFKRQKWTWEWSLHCIIPYSVNTHSQ